jgi:hypothetical protein
MFLHFQMQGILEKVCMNGTMMARRVLHALVEATTIMGQQVLCVSTDAAAMGSTFLRLVAEQEEKKKKKQTKLNHAKPTPPP